MEDRTLLTTFLVTSAADSGAGTLRQAIMSSNQSTGGTNTISFEIPGSGVQTIEPQTPLPAITHPVLIDGFAQPGYAGTPLIQIDGTDAASSDGLVITAANVTVRGLDIVSFDAGAGIHITGTAATGDWVEGCNVGVDPTGSTIDPNGEGIQIDGGASKVTIGVKGAGTSASEGNLISGNRNDGILASGAGTSDITIAGNTIGPDITGTIPLGNSVYGVELDPGVVGATIGGRSSQDMNLISSNGGDGIYIDGNGATSDLIEGDRIGTDVTGTVGMGNGWWGIELVDAANNTVGGPQSGAGNLISGNYQGGVAVHGALATDVVIQGNKIGTDITGMQPVGNAYSGVYIGDWGIPGDAASDALIGGTAPGDGNLISANHEWGVSIDGVGASGNLIEGNLIGTDVTGDSDGNTLVLGNYYSGVAIYGGSYNTIGGTAGGAGNVISDNEQNGVIITGQTATGNLIEGNLIGTDSTGVYPYGNSDNGVVIDSPGNTIGGTVAGARNVIANNNDDGILLSGYSATANLIEGNLVGTDITGSQDDGSDDGNFGNGIELDGPANTVGGTTSLAANVISGNDEDGVLISGAAGLFNLIEGNMIGLDITGTQQVRNALSGIEIDGFANTIGGTAAGARNVISGNWGDGIAIEGLEATANIVQGNFIGTDITGFADTENQLGNYASGIEVDNAPGNLIGGTEPGAGNFIAYNNGPGIGITGNSSIGDELLANGDAENAGQAIDLGDDGVTYNAPAPRAGPNNDQNFPIVVETPSGRLEGWLGGCAPNTTYLVDVFASGDIGPGGAGEAQQQLGFLNVTTDAQGQVEFSIPFTAPGGLPLITATATDPFGNTSEVTAERRTSLEAPSKPVFPAAGEPVVFAPANGNAIVIKDPDAGPLDPLWTFTLHSSVGTLTLSSLAGLSGIGNGTSFLTYSGTLSNLNAALDGLTYSAPAGFVGSSSLALVASTYGANAVQGQIAVDVTNLVLLVTTTADSGPGSLRQAILESNEAFGGTNTIDFDIPGAGVHTIVTMTPLPAITTPVTIDGTTQPGYSGSPLIAFGGQAAGSQGSLTIAGPDVTIRGLDADRIAVDSNTDGLLVADLQPQGGSGTLSLLDELGRDLVQSDGLSPSNPDALLDEHVSAGVYYLQVTGPSSDELTLNVTMASASSPFTPLPTTEVIAAGDFTGNGILDLATPEGIYLGAGDGTFQAPTQALDLPDDTSNYTAIAAGDLSGNGILDLVLTDETDNTVVVLMGNGNGTFQPAVSYDVGIEPVALILGDFTGTGILDIAVADQGNSIPGLNELVPGGVSVLLGNGDGTFRPAVEYAAGTYPNAIVAGDFTDNGRLDLAVTDGGNGSQAGGVSVLLGAGNGTFTEGEDADVGGSPISIAAGVFTASGQIDLVVADESNNVADILLGNGNGTFGAPQVVDTDYDPVVLVVGDFNGDGKLDVAVASQDGTLSLLAGNGDGTFQAPTYTTVGDGSPPSDLITGDFNRDGVLDLAMDYEDGLAVLIGNGNGTFRTPEQAVTGRHPTDMVTGDFNGDGKLDLATSNGDGTISILLGNGDGSFQPQRQFDLPIPADSELGPIVAGDFNGDGRLDLAVLDMGESDGPDSGGIYVLPGNGDGTFQPAYEVGALDDPTQLIAGDFTGNGILDLVAADQNGIEFLQGNGDGTFQAPRLIATASDVTQLVAGDFNGDGRLDLAYQSYTATGPNLQVTILLGNGDGTFQAPLVAPGELDLPGYPGGTGPALLIPADLNGDGDLDLIWDLQPDVQADVSTGIYVMLGNGNGTFGLPQFVPGTSDAYDVVAGDFSGDGTLDLAIAESNGIYILQGNGNGTFQLPVQIATEQNDGLLVAGDFTGDGRLDLAATGGTSDVTVVLDEGDDTFASPAQLAGYGGAPPLVVDVNGDGTSDVLVVDTAGDILYRQGIPTQPGTFAPPIIVNPGMPSRDIAWVPSTILGPVLASVDTLDNGVSLYAFRDGGFVLVGSLATGPLPAQILSADLTGNGQDDLVVLDEGNGTLSIFVNNGEGSFLTGFTAFRGPFTISVGAGISDVELLDSGSHGLPSLVTTSDLTGQVSILDNLGNGHFAPPVPYASGPGLSEIDESGATDDAMSQDETAGVAAGPLTPGGPISLVTIDAGSDTIDILAGLGPGAFANPTSTVVQGTVLAVRMADFTGNGLDDVAVLTSTGLDVYLANGQGGLLPPTSYDVPAGSDGLSVADINQDGKLDLLVADAHGDLLVLLGNGAGGFAPYRNADQTVELAVADLSGNGSKDIIYADQGLDRVVVDYGAGDSSVLADQSTGLLDPGAVQLVDLNGDGIPDLVVADSGGNDVLIYPGLGNGQFGPALDGGRGYFVGTDPVGITAADLTGPLPDLIIADEGSNQVSILLNDSQVGGPISFSTGPRLNSGGVGPVSTLVGNYTGGAYPDLLVTNSGSNDVALLPGVGKGFFNDQDPRVYQVGSDPVTSFVGSFNGQPDLLTVNAGSDNLTLISGFEGADLVVTEYASGGEDPTTAFDFSGGEGFDDLVVGNSEDGALALFEGGSEGLELVSVDSEPNLPDPTALAFSVVAGGSVEFYAATAGRESAELVSLSLSIQLDSATQSLGASDALAVGSSGSSGIQLVALHDSSLPLAATGLTLTLELASVEPEMEADESGVSGLLAVAVGPSTSVGQGWLASSRSGGVTASPDDPDESGPPADRPAPALSPWERFMLGLDDALEDLKRRGPSSDDVPSEPAAPRSGQNLPAQPANPGPAPTAEPPGQGAPAETHARAPMVAADLIDLALADWPSIHRPLLGRGGQPDDIRLSVGRPGGDRGGLTLFRPDPRTAWGSHSEMSAAPLWFAAAVVSGQWLRRDGSPGGWRQRRALHSVRHCLHVII